MGNLLRLKDIYHSFSTEIDEMTPIQGEIKGVPGYYRYTWNYNLSCNHRMFEPDWWNIQGGRMENILSNMLPPELMARGIYLEKYVGCHEYAWKFDDAKNVLVYLINQGYFILGGDVYRVQRDKISIDANSWYYVGENQKSKDENIKASYEKAIEFLDRFHELFGGDYLYTIVFSEYITGVPPDWKPK
jgi:hypothetical protein